MAVPMRQQGVSPRLHPILKEKLPPHMGAYPWLSPGRSSAHVSAGTIGTWIGCVGTAAGLDGLAPHRLRPTHSDRDDQRRHRRPEGRSGVCTPRRPGHDTDLHAGDR